MHWVHVERAGCWCKGRPCTGRSTCQVTPLPIATGLLLCPQLGIKCCYYSAHGNYWLFWCWESWSLWRMFLLSANNWPRTPLVQGQVLSCLSAKPVPSLCLLELNAATKSLMWFGKQVDGLTCATQYWSIYRASNAYNLWKHLENAEVQILIWRDKQLFSLGEEDRDLADPRLECWIHQSKDVLVV